MDFMGGYLQRLSQIESSGNPNAQNPNSSAKGLYQFVNSTANQYGLANPNDPVAAAQAAQRLTQDNFNTLKSALGRDPSPGELYLAHQQGATGALKLLSNPDAQATTVVNPKAILNNGGDEGVTAGDFANQWINKFGQDMPGDQPEPQYPPIQEASNDTSSPLPPVDSDPEKQEEPTHTVDVKLPDGTVIKGVPSNITRTELTEKLSKNGYDVSQLKDKPEKKGMISRMDEDIGKRLDYAKNQAYLAISGQQPSSLSSLAIVGSTGWGGLNDIAKEASTSALSALGSVTPQPVKDKLSSIASGISNSSLGGLVKDVSGSAVDKYDQFQKDNPKTSTALNAIGNMVSGAGLLKFGGPVAEAAANAAVSPTVGVAKSASKTILSTKKMVDGLGAEAVDKLDQTAKNIGLKSSKAYQSMRENGAVLTGEAGTKIVDGLENTMKEDGILNPRLHDKVIGLMSDLKDRASQGGLSLEELDQWRQLFGEVAGNFTDKINGRKASILINSIDDAVDGIKDGDLISGSKDAVDSLKEGRSLYRAKRKYETIADIVRKSDGDANYLKRELKKLRDNPKKSRGFTEDEMGALDDAASLSGGEAILKLLGKFGFDAGKSRIGSGVGALVGAGAAGAALGGPAAIAAPVIGTAARYAQKAIAGRKVQNLLDMIEEGTMKSPGSTSALMGLSDPSLNSFGGSEMGKFMIDNKDMSLKNLSEYRYKKPK